MDQEGDMRDKGGKEIVHVAKNGEYHAYRILSHLHCSATYAIDNRDRFRE